MIKREIERLREERKALRRLRYLFARVAIKFWLTLAILMLWRGSESWVFWILIILVCTA